MARNLGVIISALNASRIRAGARITTHGRLEVWLGESARGLREAALFRLDQLGEAADWLAASALRHFPRSPFATVWRAATRGAPT